MKQRTPIELDLIARGIMVTVPVVMVRNVFLKTFGKYVAGAIPFIDGVILLGLLLMAAGFGIIIFKIIRVLLRKRLNRFRP
jgi:hypothetical protein